MLVQAMKSHVQIMAFLPPKLIKQQVNILQIKNIFENLIGKCSVYKNKLRAAGATYTAQEFNLLNDLNNISINGRKLSKQEKEAVIEEVKTANSFNMRKILKKITGEEIETLTGARLDKNEKEDFHKFAQYNTMRKEFEKMAGI